MFKPKTDKIKEISENKVEVIGQLESLFCYNTRIYIDYANVRPWSTKLGWNIDEKRLKQFLDSFEEVKEVSFYNGYLLDDENYKKDLENLERYGYTVRTKPVKEMKFFIDTSSIKSDDTSLIDHFIRRSLLRKFDIETVEYINSKLGELNKKGEYYITDRKCNFDVEIGVDMLLDLERENTDTFILWSGDSDFADPIEKILNKGKKVIIFATARKVSRELNDLKIKGLVVFDIVKIKEFICWNRQI